MKLNFRSETSNIFYKTMTELMQMFVKREWIFVLAFKTHTPLRTDRIAHTLFDNQSVGHRAFRPCLWPSKQKVTLSELEKYEFASTQQRPAARNTLTKCFPGTRLQIQKSAWN